MAESFFKTLKRELAEGRSYGTRDEAKQDIFKYIELYYNRVRMHSLSLIHICWRVSVHADSDLMVGMLRDLVGIVCPTEGRPLTVHTDGGAVYMGREWREACGPGVVRSMSRRARNPDNARAEGFFGTLKCDFFEGRDWTGVPFDEFSRLLGEYIE